MAVSMRSRSMVVLLALAELACGKRAPSGIAGVTDAGLEADGAAAIPEVAQAPEAGADSLLLDAAGADAGLRSPGELAYQQFIDAYNDRYRRRLVGCFNFNAST